MFWDNIREELKRLNATCEDWSIDYMVINKHDNICGIRGVFPNGQNYSVISHKYSYGGKEGEFEIMSSFFEEEVKGYLSEREAIKLLRDISDYLKSLS